MEKKNTIICGHRRVKFDVAAVAAFHSMLFGR